jgi:hypothetical protein
MHLQWWRTSLAACDGIGAPAPHALAQVLEKLTRTLVLLLPALTSRVAPCAHARSQIVIPCNPVNMPITLLVPFP